MMIPWLFLILFIDGCSLAIAGETTTAETIIADLSTLNSTENCAYNTTNALLPDLPCFPKGECKEIELDALGNLFVCESGYHAEYTNTTSNFAGWSNDEGVGNCSQSVPTFDSYSGDRRGVEIENIRCRKNRACNLNEFFNSNECDPGSICELPLTDSEQIKCKKGNLEVYTYNKWTQVEKNIAKYKCERHGRGLLLRGEFTTVQLLRCNIADCDSAFVLGVTDPGCTKPTCKQITVSQYSISCPVGYVLEGKEHKNTEDFWAYFNHETLTCYGKDIFTNRAEKYKTYRCKKPRGCDIDALFDADACELEKQDCQNVTHNSNINAYQCNSKDGYMLEYLYDGLNSDSLRPWREIAHHLKCEKVSNLNRMRLFQPPNNYRSAIIPDSIRCRRKKGCKLDEFYNKDCREGLECEKPTQKPDKSKTVRCNGDYFLRVQWASGIREWRNARNALCAKNQFEVTMEDSKVANNRIYHPLQFKCVRKNLSMYFNPADCEENASCVMPRQRDTSLECDPLWGLQLKHENATWEDIKTLRSEWEHFVINDGISYVRHAMIRCIKKHCTQCSNPCPSCLPNTNAKFTTPDAWNCGINSQMTIDNRKFVNTDMECSREENAVSIWKVNSTEIKPNSVECQYFCTLNSPLTSECNSNDPQCDTWQPNDDNPAPCKQTMFHRLGNSPPAELISIKCDKIDGQWKDKYDNIIPTSSNVYCHQGDCEETRIFPSCEDDDPASTCGGQYQSKGHKYYCTDPATFWSRHAEEDNWVKMENVSELYCRAGNIVANGVTMRYEFQATCREEFVVEAQEDQYSAGFYIGGTFFILVLIIIVMTTIVLRVSGKGWIHTVILEWFRGDKQTRKEATTRRGNAYSVSNASIKTPLTPSSRRTSVKKSTSPGPRPFSQSSPKIEKKTDESTRKRKAEGKLVAV